MDKDKVLQLAKLARMEMGDDEAEKLAREFDAILKYVSEVKVIAKENQPVTVEDFPLRNMTRQDAAPHEGGLYTEKILEQAPERESHYIRVKKIL